MVPFWVPLSGGLVASLIRPARCALAHCYRSSGIVLKWAASGLTALGWLDAQSGNRNAELTDGLIRVVSCRLPAGPEAPLAGLRHKLHSGGDRIDCSIRSSWRFNTRTLIPWTSCPRLDVRNRTVSVRKRTSGGNPPRRVDMAAPSNDWHASCGCLGRPAAAQLKRFAPVNEGS